MFDQDADAKQIATNIGFITSPSPGRSWRSGKGSRAANQNHQTVMIVTCDASNWEYFCPRTPSAFSGGKHD
jgi:hypothetical protein